MPPLHQPGSASQASAAAGASAEASADRAARAQQTHSQRVAAWRERFRTFVFYLDGFDPHAAAKIAKDIKTLGGPIQQLVAFFDASVSHLVTTNPAAIDAVAQGGSASKDVAKPSGLRGPSPAQKKPQLPEIILQAQKLNTKVWPAPKLQKILDTLLPSTARGLDEVIRREKLYGISTSADKDKPRPAFRPLTGIYIFVDDTAHAYRPVIAHQFPAPEGPDHPPWPVIYYTSHSSKSVFDPHVASTPNTTENDETDQEASTHAHQVAADPRDAAPLIPSGMAHADPAALSIASGLVSGSMANALQRRDPLDNRQIARLDQRAFSAAHAAHAAPPTGAAAALALTAASASQAAAGLQREPASQSSRPARRSTSAPAPSRTRLVGMSFYTRPGYCENCAIKYDEYRSHVQSKQHRAWAANQQNFLIIDNMIEKLRREPLDDPIDPYEPYEICRKEDPIQLCDESELNEGPMTCTDMETTNDSRDAAESAETNTDGHHNGEDEHAGAFEMELPVATFDIGEDPALAAKPTFLGAIQHAAVFVTPAADAAPLPCPDVGQVCARGADAPATSQPVVRDAAPLQGADDAGATTAIVVEESQDTVSEGGSLHDRQASASKAASTPAAPRIGLKLESLIATPMQSTVRAELGSASAVAEGIAAQQISADPGALERAPDSSGCTGSGGFAAIAATAAAAAVFAMTPGAAASPSGVAPPGASASASASASAATTFAAAPIDSEKTPTRSQPATEPSQLHVRSSADLSRLLAAENPPDEPSTEALATQADATTPRQSRGRQVDEGDRPTPDEPDEDDATGAETEHSAVTPLRARGAQDLTRMHRMYTDHCYTSMARRSATPLPRPPVSTAMAPTHDIASDTVSTHIMSPLSQRVTSQRTGSQRPIIGVPKALPNTGVDSTTDAVGTSERDSSQHATMISHPIRLVYDLSGTSVTSMPSTDNVASDGVALVSTPHAARRLDVAVRGAALLADGRASCPAIDGPTSAHVVSVSGSAPALAASVHDDTDPAKPDRAVSLRSAPASALPSTTSAPGVAPSMHADSTDLATTSLPPSPSGAANSVAASEPPHAGGAQVDGTSVNLRTSHGKRPSDEAPSVRTQLFGANEHSDSQDSVGEGSRGDRADGRDAQTDSDQDGGHRHKRHATSQSVSRDTSAALPLPVARCDTLPAADLPVDDVTAAQMPAAQPDAGTPPEIRQPQQQPPVARDGELRAAKVGTPPPAPPPGFVASPRTPVCSQRAAAPRSGSLSPLAARRMGTNGQFNAGRSRAASPGLRGPGPYTPRRLTRPPMVLSARALSGSPTPAVELSTRASSPPASPLRRTAQ
ncbi:Cdc7p-Dbf4p kinase complex regulatory subunit [Polyrhizophydium stewartii]|uniref:Cdc7p-Dbf4p kinase complex regulatory subunit n=1 Tax=Polyrhizophydium stewartii TaxID=2732419 RepID=A0ABR4N4R1_9FUNG